MSYAAALKAKVPFRVKVTARAFLDWFTNAETRINTAETAAFIKKAFAAVNFNGIPGDYVEFGTGHCNTFRLASQANVRSSRPLRKLWGFDSFNGLPVEPSERDAHRAWIPGTMACSEERFRQYCRRYGVRNFELVPGFYSESLPKIGADFLPQGQIAFAYIDCDLYASTLDVLRFLRPRLQPGMILAFDDYFCVNRTGMSGEARAFRELYMSEPDSPFTFEPYIQYGWAGMSFVVATR